MSNREWYETFVLFNRRDALTGAKISGAVMTRVIDGVRQYREMTDAEEQQHTIWSAW